MSNAAMVGYAEIDLLAPLVAWLQRRRQVRHDAVIVEELPWLGRRVDLAVLTRSGIASSFELKLAHNRRAMEQSYLNGVAFDRSYLVTATRPSPTNLEQAKSQGIGVIHVALTSAEVSLVLPAALQRVDPRVRLKLRRVMAARG
jgi:hypothetical protein